MQPIYYYDDEDPEADKELSEDPFEGYDKQPGVDRNFEARKWWVSVTSLRPWAEFSDPEVWPLPAITEFEIGTLPCTAVSHGVRV